MSSGFPIPLATDAVDPFSSGEVILDDLGQTNNVQLITLESYFTPERIFRLKVQTVGYEGGGKGWPMARHDERRTANFNSI